MKINVNEHKAIIPKIDGFNCKIIDEEEYRHLQELAGDISPFLLADNMLCLLTSKTQGKEKYYFIQPIATNLRVIYCNKNLITKECNYTVEAEVNNEFIQFTVSSEVLTVNGLKELLKMGVLFDERYGKDIQRYLIVSAQKAETKLVHTHLGWVNDTFLSYKIFSNNNVLSEYRGNIDFRPNGSKDTYLDMIKSQVLEYTPLLFVWIIGFCSIILAYLNRHFDFGCLIFALNNLSSKGKTTAAMLSTSISSNPIFDRGLITNLSGTSNAVLNFVSRSNGHTVVLDEVGMAEALQSRKLLYQMCSGRERKRLNTSGELKETAEFNSAIVVTGEHSIIEYSAPNGIRARIFEITDDLTVSAENSNKIKSCVLKNYALLWDEFCSYVVTHKDNLLNDYNDSLNELKNDYSGNKAELTERILEKLSLIYLTAKYVKEVFELEIDLLKIKEYIYILEDRIKNTTNISSRAFDLVVQYVTQNGSRFSKGDTDYLYNTDGKLVQKQNKTQLVILKSVVDSILQKNKIENINQIYHNWKEQGISICEKDRPYKRLIITNALPRQDCLVFEYKNDFIPNNKTKNNITFEVSDDYMDIFE